MKPAPGPQIDLGDDAELIALLEEREMLSRRVRADQQRIEEIRAVISNRLGEATYGRVANWEVFWAEALYRERLVPEQLRRSLWVRRIRNITSRGPKMRQRRQLRRRHR
jgi:hypothetical protein